MNYIKHMRLTGVLFLTALSGACSTNTPTTLASALADAAEEPTVTPKPSATVMPHPSKLHTLDVFDGRPRTANCSSFQGEKAVNAMSYCLYHNDSEAQLSLAKGEKDPALLIMYALPSIYSWLSVRRETGNLIDLRDYSGIRLRVRVEKPAADVILRITLADVASVADARVKGRDELWWCDNKGFLDNPSGDWQTVLCPFADFHESYGTGTRQNNHSLDLSRIVGYEINLVSEARANAEGSVIVDSLEAFK